MRFLIMHVNSFCCTITTRGRSKVYEEYDDPVTRVDEALIVLASIPSRDREYNEVRQTGQDDQARWTATANWWILSSGRKGINRRYRIGKARCLRGRRRTCY